MTGMDSEPGYFDSLQAWCHANDGVAPDDASALGRAFFAQGLSPDQIVALHAENVEKAIKPRDARGIVAAQLFLLEVMLAYGAAHREQSEAAKVTAEEIRVAAEAAMAQERQRTRDARSEARQHLELLANVTHELGTPLTVIQGNVAVLRKFSTPRDLLPAEIAVQDSDLDAAIDRMTALRDQLLTANREQEQLELVPLILDHQVERAARWAEPAVKQKGLRLQLNLGCGEGMISADEQALASVLGNLYSNAIRYTPKGGTISCSTRRGDASLIVDVADTGMGMSEQVLSRIFDRFYRSEEAKQLSGFGLGLGLFLTKGLVEAMGATISVNSVLGQGSTFSVAFPRLEE